MNVVKTATTGTGWTASNNSNIKFAQNSNYTLFFNDGIVFTFKNNVGNCTEGNSGGTTTESKCYGVIDVNGEKNPNKEVKCDSGTTGDNCQVSNPTDIYPVVMYDQTILPATRAGEAVLYGAGK